MTSKNLSELYVDTVDFNNDWNHLPPNGNKIPPSTRSTLTTYSNTVVSLTTPTRVVNYNPYRTASISPIRPASYNPYRTTVASPVRPADYNPYRTTTTIDYAESLAKKYLLVIRE